MAKKAKKKPAAPKVTMLAFHACESVQRSAEPRNAGTDGKAGKASLINIFDVIWVSSTPAMFRPFYLFAKLKGSIGEGSVLLRGYGSDKKLFGEGEAFKIKFGNDGGAEIIVELPMLPIPQLGTIRFEILIDNKVVGWPCEIQIRQRPQEEGSDE